MGESVGVFAEPEQLVLNVTKDDKFIVIASDGVFEFITSHKVLSERAAYVKHLYSSFQLHVVRYRRPLSLSQMIHHSNCTSGHCIHFSTLQGRSIGGVIVPWTGRKKQNDFIINRSLSESRGCILISLNGC